MPILLTTIGFVLIVFVVMTWQDSLMNGIGDYGRADVSDLSRQEQIILDDNRRAGIQKSTERIRLEILLFNHPAMEAELMGEIGDLTEEEIKSELTRLSVLIRSTEYVEPRQVTENGTLLPRKGYQKPKKIKTGAEMEVNGPE